VAGKDAARRGHCFRSLDWPAHGGILVGHALPEDTEALWYWRLTQDADTLIQAACILRVMHRQAGAQPVR